MTPRQSRQAYDLFVAAVAVSIVLALAGLTWRIVAWLSYRPSTTLAGAPSAAAQTPIDVTPILALAPFGDGATGAPTPTTLPIELRGVMLTVPQEASSVLIAPSGGTALSYRIGQALPGGATIASIGMDSVILGVSGHRELLTFPRRGSVAPPPPAGMPSQPVAGAAAPASTGTPPAAVAPSPQTLLDSLGASPVSGGYRVSESLSPAVRQAGLLPGDVIQQVNGTQLGNPAMDGQVLSAAARSGTVRLDLVRNGRKTTITVPLR